MEQYKQLGVDAESAARLSGIWSRWCSASREQRAQRAAVVAMLECLPTFLYADDGSGSDTGSADSSDTQVDTGEVVRVLLARPSSTWARDPLGASAAVTAQAAEVLTALRQAQANETRLHAHVVLSITSSGHGFSVEQNLRLLAQQLQHPRTLTDSLKLCQIAAAKHRRSRTLAACL